MISCGFFDSVDKDRLYRADEMTRPYELLVSNGVFATPEGTPSNYLQVNAHEGMDVIVKVGRGIFKDKWLINDADMILTVGTSEVTLTRIDSVIVKVNTSESVRAGTIEIKKGTPASEPVPPTMERSTDVHEYRLANITVGPLVTDIKQMDISDQRGSADCPWVTSLVKQVDTSTLFKQWEDAYEKYYAKVEKEYTEYYASNKARFDAYYTDVKKTFDDFYASNSNRFDTFYNNTSTRFDTLHSEIEGEFDTYYAENDARFKTFYNSNSKRFEDYYNSTTSKFDTYYSENDQRFDAYYAENEETFNTWFQEMKDTAGNLTLIRMYNGYHLTTEAGQTVIPISIDQFNNALDILQVYINGLLAVEGVDYTIASIPAESITLLNGVEVGTMVSFNVIKSSDAVTSDSVIQQVAAMEKKISELEARIAALE